MNERSRERINERASKRRPNTNQTLHSNAWGTFMGVQRTLCWRWYRVYNTYSFWRAILFEASHHMPIARLLLASIVALPSMPWHCSDVAAFLKYTLCLCLCVCACEYECRMFVHFWSHISAKERLLSKKPIPSRANTYETGWVTTHATWEHTMTDNASIVVVHFPSQLSNAQWLCCTPSSLLQALMWSLVF